MYCPYRQIMTAQRVWAKYKLPDRNPFNSSVRQHCCNMWWMRYIRTATPSLVKGHLWYQWILNQLEKILHYKFLEASTWVSCFKEEVRKICTEKISSPVFSTMSSTYFSFPLLLMCNVKKNTERIFFRRTRSKYEDKWVLAHTSSMRGTKGNQAELLRVTYGGIQWKLVVDIPDSDSDTLLCDRHMATVKTLQWVFTGLIEGLVCVQMVPSY